MKNRASGDKNGDKAVLGVMLRAVRNLARVVGIARALARHGASHPDTIRALKANNPALGPALRPPWAALALIALVVLVALPW